MKRTLKILFLPGLLLAAAGCVHEKYDECPPEKNPYNVSLEFSLRDSKGNPVFDSNISTVDLGIYDADGMLVMTKQVPTMELSVFQGVKLTLNPGVYHVVGWGNIGGNAQYKGMDVLHPYGSHVTYVNTNSGKATDTDKVYYAPESEGRSRTADLSNTYRMIVDPVTGHTGVLEFTAAYRTVKVYIEGYDGTPGVELRNLPEGLAWIGMRWLTDASGSKLMLAASRTTIPEEKEGVWYDYAAFDTFYFDADNEIVVCVVDHSAQEVVFAITLNEALEEIGSPIGTIISIVLRFTPAGVEVDIPKWENHEVDPGLVM